RAPAEFAVGASRAIPPPGWGSCPFPLLPTLPECGARLCAGSVLIQTVRAAPPRDACWLDSCPAGSGADSVQSSRDVREGGIVSQAFAHTQQPISPVPALG